jgi:carboxylesterase type B
MRTTVLHALRVMSVGIAASFAGCAVTTPSANFFEDAPGGPTVATRTGRVQGVDGDVVAFKGVPYAKSPVGTLRWTAPSDPVSEAGIRKATEYGPQCIQAGNAPMSEDCLFANVWAPKSAVRAGSRLPVMVWVYGGSFVQGNGNVDGIHVARRGVVVVSMNYRVSTLGFMAHPQLSAESPDKVSGNYGILDIAQALKWVQTNIDRFGGDPRNVTIWGESSGASAITALMSSPRSAGLFHRAILQSPGSWRQWKPLAVAEKDGLSVGPDIAALRALPADQVPAIRNTGGGAAFRSLVEPRVIGPAMDGVVLPAQERQQYLTGHPSIVPLLVGNNTNEGIMFTGGYKVSTVAQYQSYLEDPSIFGSQAAEAARVYPVGSDADVGTQIALSFGDDQFWFGARGLARLYTQKAVPVYRYYFTRKQRGGSGPDTIHADDVAYVFGESKLSKPPYTADDVGISDAMMDGWVRFAATGNPNGGLIQNWPRYQLATEPVYQIDTKPQTVYGPRNAELDFIDRMRASARR